MFATVVLNPLVDLTKVVRGILVDRRLQLSADRKKTFGGRSDINVGLNTA